MISSVLMYVQGLYLSSSPYYLMPFTPIAEFIPAALFFYWDLLFDGREGLRNWTGFLALNILIITVGWNILLKAYPLEWSTLYGLFIILPLLITFGLIIHEEIVDGFMNTFHRIVTGVITIYVLSILLIITGVFDG